MTEYDLGKVVGDDGEAGNGIASITKTGTSGLVDTYTITYDDGDTDTFTVTNGSDASVTIQTSWGSTTSDSKVPSEKLTKDSLDDKVSKSSTTGLLKNDGTVMTSGTGSSNYSAGNHTHSGYVSATKVTSWSGTVSDSNVPSEKLVKNTIDGLSIPTKTSDLTNDGDGTNAFLTQHQSLSNYVQKSSTTGLLKNDGTVMTSGTGSSNWAVGNHTHSGYATSTHSHGYILSDGTVTNIITPSASYSFSGFLGVFEDLDDVGYKIIPASFNTDYIKNTNALANLGASANSTQAYINGRINTLIATKLTATKVTSWSSTPSDDNVASEKLVKDTFDDIEDLIGDAITYINQ